MLSKLSKTLFASALISLGTFGLSACGDDNSSGASSIESSDSNTPSSNPSLQGVLETNSSSSKDSTSTEPGQGEPGEKIGTSTKNSAYITVSPDIGSRISGDDVRFTGRFGFDLVVDSLENSFDIAFTGISYKVGKGSDSNNMTEVAAVVISNTIVFPTENTIDLNSMNSAFVSVSLLDPAFTECGVYSLVVTVNAAIGEKPFQRTEIIPFEREAAEYCRDQNPEPPPQPQVQEIPMKFCEVTVSTNLNPGLDFASCTAVPAPATTADIIFSKAGTRDNPEITATSGNGTQFAPISNGDLLPSDDDYEVNMWPEDMNPDRVPATAYVSDFKYKALGATLSDMIENSNQIYVAATTAYNKDTGAGFYAFAITDPSQGNNGDYTLTLKVYKVE